MAGPGQIYVPGAGVSSAPQQFCQSGTNVQRSDQLTASASLLLGTLGSNIGSRMDFFGQASSASANYTFESTIAAAAPFQAVQLGYVNYSTTTNYTIFGATVAPSGNLTDDGTTLSWTPATFSSGNVNDLPPTYYTTTAGFSVPHGLGPSSGGAGDNSVPGWAASDWIPVSSIPRTDGGSLPLLQVRTNISTACVIHNEAGQANFESQIAPYIWYTNLHSDSGGAYVTNPTANALAGSASGLWVVPQFVKFAYTGLTGLNVVAVGDSITRGQTTNTRTTTTPSWANIACQALSTQSRPITLTNMGWSGQSKNPSYRNTVWAINNLLPDVIVFWNGSVNDGVSDYVVNRSWNTTLNLVNYAKSQGVIPVVVTQTPNSSSTATQDAYRQQMNANTRSLASAGVFVLDADFLLSTGGLPSRLQSQYDSGGGIHPNALGYQTIGAAFQGILSAILGSR